MSSSSPVVNDKDPAMPLPAPTPATNAMCDEIASSCIQGLLASSTSPAPTSNVVSKNLESSKDNSSTATNMNKQQVDDVVADGGVIGVRAVPSTHENPNHCHRPSTSIISTNMLVQIAAPPGALGLILNSNCSHKAGIFVAEIASTSVMKDQISIGDELIAVDGQDVRTLISADVAKIMRAKIDNPTRMLSIIPVSVAQGKQEVSAGPSSASAASATVSAQFPSKKSSTISKVISEQSTVGKENSQQPIVSSDMNTNKRLSTEDASKFDSRKKLKLLENTSAHPIPQRPAASIQEMDPLTKFQNKTAGSSDPPSGQTTSITTLPSSTISSSLPSREYTVYAPAGNMGIYLSKTLPTTDGVCIENVETTSPLFKLVSVGDRIVAIDGEWVCGKTMGYSLTLLKKKATNYVRRITLFTDHKDENANVPESAAPVEPSSRHINISPRLPYKEAIIKTLEALNETGGSSVQTLQKYVQEGRHGLHHGRFFMRLHALVADGTLVQNGSFYALSPKSIEDSIVFQKLHQALSTRSTHNTRILNYFYPTLQQRDGHHVFYSGPTEMILYRYLPLLATPDFASICIDNEVEEIITETASKLEVVHSALNEYGYLERDGGGRFLKTPKGRPNDGDRCQEIIFNYAKSKNLLRFRGAKELSGKYCLYEKVQHHLVENANPFAFLISLMGNDDIAAAIMSFLRSHSCSGPAIVLANGYWDCFISQQMDNALDETEKLYILRTFWSNFILLSQAMNEYHDDPAVAEWRSSTTNSRKILLDFDKEVLDLLMEKKLDALLALHHQRDLTVAQESIVDETKKIPFGMMPPSRRYAEIIDSNISEYNSANDKELFVQNLAQSLVDDGWVLERQVCDMKVAIGRKIEKDLRIASEEGLSHLLPPQFGEKEVGYGIGLSNNNPLYVEFLESKAPAFLNSNNKTCFAESLTASMLKDGWKLVEKKRSKAHEMGRLLSASILYAKS